jgi:ABC-type sugar transport system ATPase subunit
VIRVILDGLVKRHDRVAVVDGVALEIRPGEMALVLGPPGAGKTTLARLIAGLEPPDEGDVYFDGRLMNGVPPRSGGWAWSSRTTRCGPS